MLKNFFISDSFAQETVSSVAAAPDFSFGSFVPLVLIFVIFYFLIIRPQSKKMKDHENLVKSLKVGNKVVTSGGFIGTVHKVEADKNEIEIELAEGVVVKMLKNYVSDITAAEKEKLEKKEKTKNKK